MNDANQNITGDDQNDDQVADEKIVEEILPETESEETSEEVQTEQPQETDELTLANQKVEELTVAAKQAMADLQNYRKRTQEEKSSFAKFATANVFGEILPVFDSFERAIAHLPEDLAENDWAKGIQNILRQFEQVIEKFQIKKMETVGKKFDHNLHEAIATAAGEKDIILNELEAGYSMGNYVLRHAKVQVGNGEPQA
jgi:molecular chaperone GrpE